MWAEAGKWQALAKEYNTLTSTISGNTSVSLPADFRNILSYPEITYDGTSTARFPEIRPQEESGFNPGSDRYIKILGNPNTGYTMVVNAATATRQLASGASIKILYSSVPTSLASPANVVTCPNPDYLVQGIVADIWESQEDARYQAAKVEANLILANMLEYENTPSEAAYSRQVKTLDSRYNYRWGK